MVKHFQYFKKITLILLIICNNGFADKLAQRGWYFYDDPVFTKIPVKKTPQFNSYQDMQDQINKEVQELQLQAIYNPTKENIHLYNTVIRRLGDFAFRFSMLATTDIWHDPDSGISQSAPNGAGAQSDLDKQRSQLSGLFQRVALIYFIDKNCKYCEIEANELKKLELSYNAAIRVVSLDGSTVSQYPNPMIDNGISKKLNVKKAGEIQIFDSQTNKTTILGYGYIHLDQILQRMQTLFITGTSNWNEYLKQKQPVLIERSSK